MTYLVVDFPTSVQYIDETTKQRLAEYDKQTRFGSVGADSAGRFDNEIAAGAYIAGLLDAPSDVSSADGSTGVGPYTDHLGNTYQVRLPDCTVLKNSPDGGLTGEEVGWSHKLLWKRAHQGGAGAMYQRGPFTKRWMRTVSGFPEYDPADEGQTGVPSDGRNPHDNSLPPSDSADGTEATTVNYYGSVWTIVGGKVHRDGTQFLDEDADTFLTFDPDDGFGLSLYWDDAGNWSRFNPAAGIGANARVDLGANDPRDGTPPVVLGDFVADESTGNFTAGSSTITGVPTDFWNQLEVGMKLMGESDASLVRGSLTGSAKGLGGSFPTVGVGSVGALGSASAGTLKYLTTNGQVYECQGGSTWVNIYTDYGRLNNYNYALVLARGYEGQILSLPSTGTVVCNVAAQRTVTGAKIGVNNIPILQDILDALTSETSYELPGVMLPGAGCLYIDRPNFTLRCASVDGGFKSYRGLTEACAQVIAFNESVFIENMTWVGKLEANCHSANWATLSSNGINGTPVTDAARDGGSHHGRALQWSQGCNNGGLNNVWIKDYWNGCIATFCNDVWFDGLHGRITGGGKQMEYTGWWAWHADTGGGGIRNSDIVSTYSCKGVEAFKSHGYQCFNTVLENCIVALNNAAGRVGPNVDIEFTADSSVAESYQSPHDAIIQGNKNISGGFADLGIVIDGVNVVQSGYCYKSCATHLVININPDTMTVQPIVTNITSSAPDAISTAGASVDNGTSGEAYRSGHRVTECMKTRIGNITATSGRSPNYSAGGGAFNVGTIYGSHGSSFIPGTTRTTDPDFVALYSRQDEFVW